MARRTLVLLLAAAVPAAGFGACSPQGSSGTPVGAAAVPVEARAVDTSRPHRVVGDGRPESCTSDAVVEAVAAGGIITFDCGPDPVTITLTETARIRNDTGPEVVIDGGGKVTLSGGGRRRILYQNTCDPDLAWTTSHCDDQDHPRLTVQNLTFVDGDARGQDGDGGGALFVRGGRLKIVNSTFRRNRCDETGPDVGGGAVRVLDQGGDEAVYVVNSTFGGTAGQGNACANGGALSSIGVSWTVLNSVLSHNQATGQGGNPPRAGTPGGGNGGAIAVDGNRMELRIAGSVIEENAAGEGGGGIFFVSNDRTGTLHIDTSILRSNRSGFETSGLPGVFFLGQGAPELTGSPEPEPAPEGAPPPRARRPSSESDGGRDDGGRDDGGRRDGRGDRRVGGPDPVTATPSYTG